MLLLTLVKLPWAGIKVRKSDVAGYKIYYGTATRNYTESIKITSPNITTCTIINLSDGQTYYFAATAYNTELLESDYSEEVFTTIKSIKVTWPNGGTVLNIGTTQTITWTAEEITNNLRIVLFQDGVKVGNIVDSIAPNIGTYSWTVGQFVGGTATAGTGYQIQVREIGIDVGDRSDAVFTLQDPDKQRYIEY